MMKNERKSRMLRVLIALGKATAYLALFLGAQIVVSFGYTAAVTFQMQVNGGVVDEARLYQELTDAAMGLSLLSNLLTLSIVVAFYLIRRKKLSQALWLRPVTVPTLLSGVSVTPALFFLVIGMLSLLPERWLTSYGEASSVLKDTGLVAALAIVVAAPVVEEVIFRGLMLNRLARAMPGWAAVLVSAAIFGACHGELVWFCYAFVLGVVFGLMDLRANSVLPSLLAHIAFNGINQVITTVETLFSEAGAGIVLIAILILAVVLVVVNRRTVAAIFGPAPDLDGLQANVDTSSRKDFTSGASYFTHDDTGKGDDLP